MKFNFYIDFFGLIKYISFSVVSSVADPDQKVQSQIRIVFITGKMWIKNYSANISDVRSDITKLLYFIQ